ncbi:hypothetical protein ACFY00_33120 [Kitasatospora sp. NPDC001540]|uniref:hypothetical protein n=1 Tax=Kitasatospora sp. NPDC001540 TaxID=3364014 RepID=UPI00369E883C
MTADALRAHPGQALLHLPDPASAGQRSIQARPDGARNLGVPASGQHRHLRVPQPAFEDLVPYDVCADAAGIVDGQVVGVDFGVQVEQAVRGGTPV